MGRCAVCCTSKFWLVMAVMALTFLCSGVIYGWTGMLLVLRKEGVYSQYPEGEQEEKFDLIITIASFFTAGSGLFIGIFLDAFGPRITAACAGAVTIAGCFVFGYQINLTVGYALFAVGGMGILISSFRAAYLFPGNQSLVIGSISCLFDSSTVIFVIFDLLNEQFDISLKALCMGYGALTLLLQIILFAMWTMNPTFDRLPVKGDEEDDEAQGLLNVATASSTNAGTVMPSDAFEDEEEEVLVADLPFSKQVKTPEFVFVFIFCCVQMFRSNMFLGTAGNFLLSLGDGRDDNEYAKILASIIPLGFVFVPVISFFLDRKGFALSAYMVVLIGLGYGGLSLVPNLQVQLATAMLFTFFRAALFSFVAAFNAKVFGPASVGRVTGILYTTTALLIVLQYPLTTVTVHTFHNNYQPLHALLTFLCALMLADVAFVQCYSKEVGPPLPDMESDDEEEEVEAGLKAVGTGKGAGTYTAPTSPESQRSRRSRTGSNRKRSGSHLGLPRSWSMGSEQSFIEAADGKPAYTSPSLRARPSPGGADPTLDFSLPRSNSTDQAPGARTYGSAESRRANFQSR